MHQTHLCNSIFACCQTSSLPLASKSNNWFLGICIFHHSLAPLTLWPPSLAQISHQIFVFNSCSIITSIAFVSKGFSFFVYLSSFFEFLMQFVWFFFLGFGLGCERRSGSFKFLYKILVIVGFVNFEGLYIVGFVSIIRSSGFYFAQVFRYFCFLYLFELVLVVCNCIMAHFFFTWILFWDVIEDMD